MVPGFFRVHLVNPSHLQTWFYVCVRKHFSRDRLDRLFLRDKRYGLGMGPLKESERWLAARPAGRKKVTYRSQLLHCHRCVVHAALVHHSESALPHSAATDRHGSLIKVICDTLQLIKWETVKTCSMNRTGKSCVRKGVVTFSQFGDDTQTHTENTD